MGRKKNTQADSAESKKLVSKPKAKQRSEAYLKYQRYIKSKEFDIVRKACFERDHNSCRCCGWSPDDYIDDLKSTHRSLSCHHICYDHLYDELNHMEDVITLCSVCHCAIHRSPSNFSRFKNKPK